MAFYVGPNFCKSYLHQTLVILQSACYLTALTENFENDPDTLEFLEQLRSCLLDTYTPISQSVLASGAQSIYQPFMQDLFNWLEVICRQPNIVSTGSN